LAGGMQFDSNVESLDATPLTLPGTPDLCESQRGSGHSRIHAVGREVAAQQILSQAEE